MRNFGKRLPILTLGSAALLVAGCGESALAPRDPGQGTSVQSPAAALGASSRLVRTTWPSDEDPGPPFYARIDASGILIVDGWAVIPFYRDPGCIPADFNLLNFFDAPGAFACEAMVEGFSLWHAEAFAGAPKTVQTQGITTVPFWFVPADALLDAIADGVLTISELADLPGRLTGAANRYHEILQPHPLPDFLGGGGHPNPKLVISAEGSLDDGRRFQFHVTRLDSDIVSIRLQLR